MEISGATGFGQIGAWMIPAACGYESRRCAASRKGTGAMPMFEWILVLLLAAVILTNLAERLAVPYRPCSRLQASVLLPAVRPQIRIEPELALALFVAPALLDAAFDTSRAICAATPFRLRRWP